MYSLSLAEVRSSKIRQYKQNCLDYQWLNAVLTIFQNIQQERKNSLSNPLPLPGFIGEI
jgi:hypothetical protein